MKRHCAPGGGRSVMRRQPPNSRDVQLELGPEPHADGPRPPGNDVDPVARTAGGDARKLVAFVEDVGREQLEIVAPPIITDEEVD